MVFTYDKYIYLAKYFQESGDNSNREYCEKKAKELEPIKNRLRKAKEIEIELISEKKLRCLKNFENKIDLHWEKTNYRGSSSSSRIRKELEEEQGYKCPGLLYYDGSKFRTCNSTMLTDCDHIIELRYKGIDHKRNLQMLCYYCHKFKTRHNYYFIQWI